MTQKELAQRLNIDPKTLRNWEKSKPELLKLIYLGLATEEHIKETEEYLKKMEKLFIKS